MTFVRPEDWQPQGVQELEGRAWEALREVNRSVCVTAGAGAGKTEFLAQKAAYLLQTGLCPPPKRILAISFKRDAARTLSDRVERRCGDQARRFVSLTFDAFTKSLVDQFRRAIPAPYCPPADYEISVPTKDILNDFLRRAEINSINAQQLEKAVTQASLPVDGEHVPERYREALRSYWRDQYEGGDRCRLTFAMINRLAHYLVRTNPQILHVIRKTYPFVFLDEFQDTTKAQFQFLLTAFDRAGTIFTAVGDDKQRIMGWAGAMEDAFETFREACGAQPVHLLLNWRSHADLVAIQQLIAQRINPGVEAVEARGARNVAGDICAICEFQSREDEIENLSAWIAEEVQTERVRADDLAVLVRSRADVIEAELAPALEEHGIVLRNVARNVGDIAIQELLVEPLTEILLPFLRLGISRRDPEAWARANAELRGLEQIAADDEVGLQRGVSKIERIVAVLRARLDGVVPAGVEARQIAEILIEEIGESLIRQASPSYGRAGDYARVREGFISLLVECTEGSDDWEAALDKFEGKGQVPLMTIHKSKGMEFHTIVFFGLDNQTWWSLKPEGGEELNSFFVALTRAKQRAFFTCCTARGRRIAWLDELFGDAVQRIEGIPG
jgi:superfamily I DNA/RNA helicase